MPKRERPSCDDDNNKNKNKATAAVAAASTKSPSVTRGLAELDDIFAVKKKAKAAEEEKQAKAAKLLAKATATCHEKSKAGVKRIQSRQGLEDISPNVWVDDGLGGKFNRDGFTGRVEGGVKVFKAHLFNKKEFGQSKDCPFDCNCCFI